MPAFSEVVRRIRTDLNRGDTFDARIKEAIVDAIRWYKADRLAFNTKRASFTTADEFTSLTSDLIEIDTLRLETGTEIDPLAQVNYGYIESRKRTTDYTSRPIYYAFQNRQLRLWPAPDATYSFQMSYLYDVGAPVSVSASDAITNAWLDEGFELIRCHATADVLEQFIEGQESQQRAVVYRGKAQAAFRQLKNRANREQGSGHIQAFL